MIPPEVANDADSPPPKHLALVPSSVDRSSEERSEDDGMPEHPQKSENPAAWASAAPPA